MMNTKQLSAIVLSIIFFFISSFSWASPEKDKYFFQVLTKDPNSEQNRYEYARYLYEDEKFDQAIPQIDYVLKLNPSNLKAKKLKEYIVESKAISDPKIRKQKMLEHTMADLKENVGAMKKANDELQGVLSPAAIEKHNTDKLTRQKTLDQKYKISQSLESCEHADLALMKYEVLAVKYRAKGLKDEAIQTYREGLEKKESAGLRLGIISILLGQDKYKEAFEENEKAFNLHPKDVRFQIYKDNLQKIKSLTSSEEKAKAKDSIIENMSDVDDLLRGTCASTKK